MTEVQHPRWTVLHISDPHVGLRSADRGMRLALRRLRDLISSMTPLPTVVVVTGDLTEHGDPDEYDQAYRLLTSIGLPVRVVPGNHDRLDVMLRTPMRDLLGQCLTDVGSWRESFGDLDLIGLNSSRPQRSDGELGVDQLRWLAERLADSTPGSGSLVLLHHPPMVVGNVTMDAIRLADDVELAAVLQEAPPTAVLCGHVHRPIVAQVSGVPVFVASSLAWRTHLNLAARADFLGTTEGPSAFVHAWFDSVGLVSHHLELTDWVTEPPPRA